MAIQIACPKCKKRYQVQREMAGKRMKCPACQTQFVLNIRRSDGGQSPTSASGQRPMPSRQDYAQFGLDGPLPSNPEIFPAQSPAGPAQDPLGSAIDDPGFADIDPQRFVPPQEDVERDPIYTNPALSHSAAMTAVRSGSGKGKALPATANLANYRSASALVLILSLLLVFYVLMDVVSSAGEVFLVANGFYDPASPNFDNPTKTLESVNLLTIFTALALLVSMLVTAIVFWVWIVRANKNARALGATGMRFSPGGCVGWWFVPFANLVMPVRAVGEIYKASLPGPTGTEWTRGDFPGLVGGWWALYLGGNFVSNFSARMAFSDEPGQIATGAWLGLLSSLLTVGAAVLLIKLLRSIHKMQEAGSHRAL